MVSLFDKLIQVPLHMAWYVDYQTGGHKAVRDVRRPPSPRDVLIDRR